jgi:hypothetical protein
MTFAPQDEVIAMTVGDDNVAHPLHHTSRIGGRRIGMMQVGGCRKTDLESVEVPSKSAISRLRILVVDDDEAVRDSFALALSGLDCELLFAENGIAASISSVAVTSVSYSSTCGCRVWTACRRCACCGRCGPTRRSAFSRRSSKEHMGSLIDLASESLDFELFRKPLDIDEIRALTLTLAGPDAAYTADEARKPSRVERKIRVLKRRAWRN